MNNKLIQWPRNKYWDKVWNPMIGCKPCSPACEHCYAAAWAKRFGQSFKPHATKQKPPRKGVVFCGNMTDLFGEWVEGPMESIFKTAKSALSAPPRNCDRFKTKEEAEVEFMMSDELPRDGGDTKMRAWMCRFIDWLFTTATEQKGEADAK